MFTSIEDLTLRLIVLVTIFFATSAMLVTCALICRRIIRNFQERQRLASQKRFETIVERVLERSDQFAGKQSTRGIHIGAICDVLLKYFRTFDGLRVEQLAQYICESDIEDRLIKLVRRGSMGQRMHGLQIRSYIDSTKAFVEILKYLPSQNRYQRLIATRALSRRRAVVYLMPTIASLAAAFPKDEKLISELLLKFGHGAIAGLQQATERSANPTIISACLETLAVLGPSQLMIDLDELLNHSDERVRAAALSLAAKTCHPNLPQMLKQSLSDTSVKVKIRTAKLACDTNDTTLAPLLYDLSSDTFFWVRYWAIRAMWSLGQGGQLLVQNLAAENKMAEYVIKESSHA